MKKLTYYIIAAALLLIIMLPVYLHAWTSDDIAGEWYTEGKESVVKVFKFKGKYFGRIIWLKNELDENGKEKIDKLNPDESKRTRKIKGLLILKDLEYKGDGEYDDGEIYDPKSGNSYDCSAEMLSKDKLEFRGYMGISLLGRSTEWIRKK